MLLKNNKYSIAYDKSMIADNVKPKDFGRHALSYLALIYETDGQHCLNNLSPDSKADIKALLPTGTWDNLTNDSATKEESIIILEDLVTKNKI